MWRRSSGRWAAVMLAIKSRDQCRKVILILPRSNAVRRCI
ncbi:PerC family transcriptional regulator, partial [Salmonella enterica]